MRKENARGVNSYITFTIQTQEKEKDENVAYMEGRVDGFSPKITFNFKFSAVALINHNFT